MDQKHEISGIGQEEKNMFMTTYSNMPWKSYKMYNNVEKDNGHLYKKIVGITSKQLQTKIIENDQKHDLTQNNQLLTKVRKRQQDSVRVTEENRKMFLKLYTSKSHINSQQLQQEYQQKKSIIKRLTRFPLQNSKINNQQPSTQHLHTIQNTGCMKENKSFLLSDTKCSQIIDQIDEEEINGMRDSLRDGSYKLLNFSTKENAIMATRPSTSMNIHKNSRKNISTNLIQTQYKDIQNIQNLIKNHIGNNNNNDLNSGDVDKHQKISIRKRAQSAMKTGQRIKQQDSKDLEKLFIIRNDPQYSQNNNIKTQINSQTHRKRSESICQRKMSLPDTQNLEQFANEEYQIEEIPQAYYLKPPLPEKNNSNNNNNNNQNSQSQIGQTLMYTVSNINSINQQPSIDQKSKQECTISINQIIKGNNFYQSPPEKSRQQQNNQDKSRNNTIQMKDFFEDEENKSRMPQYYYKNGKSEINNFNYKKQLFDEKSDIQKISKTQPIQQNESQDQRNITTQMTYRDMHNMNEEMQNMNKDIKRIKSQSNNRSSLQSQGGGDSIWTEQNNENVQTIKRNKINQINQQMIKICQKNNYNEQQKHSLDHFDSTINTINKYKNTNQIDLNSSPIIKKYPPVFQERSSRDTRFSYSVTKQLNVSAERSVRKSYQQNILTGKQEEDHFDHPSLHYLNLNGFAQNQQNERKQEQNLISCRKKSNVGQSLNLKPMDCSINFLQANKSQNNPGCSSINYEDISCQKIIDLPIAKRINQQGEDYTKIKKSQTIFNNNNYDDDSTINYSKNPLTYILPSFNNKKEKYQINQ